MHLFFDLDGTLTDSRPGIVASIRYALGVLAIESPADDELARLIGPPTREAFRMLLGAGDPALIERAIALYRERFGTIGLFENSVYPGVREGLDSLRACGARLSVVTSKPQVYADRIIDHFALRQYFVRVVGPALSDAGSDKAQLIARALESDALSAPDTWMIGDRMHDIVGAKKNGVRAVGVLWGYGSRQELVEAKADALYETMADLVRDVKEASPG
jgi:phosphoglycolate phosphatase